MSTSASARAPTVVSPLVDPPLHIRTGATQGRRRHSPMLVRAEALDVCCPDPGRCRHSHAWQWPGAVSLRAAERPWLVVSPAALVPCNVSGKSIGFVSPSVHSCDEWRCSSFAASPSASSSSPPKNCPLRRSRMRHSRKRHTASLTSAALAAYWPLASSCPTCAASRQSAWSHIRLATPLSGLCERAFVAWTAFLRAIRLVRTNRWGAWSKIP